MSPGGSGLMADILDNQIGDAAFLWVIYNNYYLTENVLSADLLEVVNAPSIQNSHVECSSIISSENIKCIEIKSY